MLILLSIIARAYENIVDETAALAAGEKSFVVGVIDETKNFPITKKLVLKPKDAQFARSPIEMLLNKRLTKIIYGLNAMLDSVRKSEKT